MPDDPAICKKRIESLRGLAKPDHLLILNGINIRYLTGFTGGEGALLIAPDRVNLLVDGRYTTQAALETSGLEITEFQNKTDGISTVLKKQKADVVGFETSSVTVGEYRKLKDSLAGVSLEPVSESLDFLRAVKDAGEIARIREAIRIAEKALTDVKNLIKPGIREMEIAVELEYRMRKAGAERISFDTIVATGPNAALPHAMPGNRQIEAGDFVLIDYGAVFNGYHSDQTRMFCVGSPSDRQRKAYQAVLEAHDRAVMAIKAGVSCKEIDGAARSVLEEKGFGKYFSHGTGHGVGLEVHEAPTLSRGKEDRLKTGMVVTVEPGVYFPEEWGIRIEDMVLVGENGCEVLTKMFNGLVEL
jgi:Xaa-Pro aminopeptidase/Xaa-Pro dipeptidase